MESIDNDIGIQIALETQKFNENVNEMGVSDRPEHYPVIGDLEILCSKFFIFLNLTKKIFINRQKSNVSTGSNGKQKSWFTQWVSGFATNNASQTTQKLIKNRPTGINIVRNSKRCVSDRTDGVSITGSIERNIDDVRDILNEYFCFKIVIYLTIFNNLFEKL